MKNDNPKIAWRMHEADETVSTNLDARGGRAGDVFLAKFQTGGRGRLNHTWVSRAGENLMMSAVLDCANFAPEKIATFPLVVGLSVADALSRILNPREIFIKWPNDIFAKNKKIAGILCERHESNVIAGIGVNVNQREFSRELAPRATSLALCGREKLAIASVRDMILDELAKNYCVWREKGFEFLWPRLVARDFLRGRQLAIVQTDDDARPISGLCGGIARDGSLIVGDQNIYAGEAHVLMSDM